MNIYNKREICIFCNNNLNKCFFDEDKYIIISSNICDSKDNTKIKIPYNILICNNCYCLQNKYLGNIELVYNDNHNNVVISDTWKNHYIQFYNFIINLNIITKDSLLLEIGAGNNYIVNQFIKNKFLNYTILEPVITEKTEGITYISGWLEDYKSKKINDLVILSHVFEHLYSPMDLFKVKSKYIAISIPNIPKYLENNIINFLNIEHTFYYEESHIETFFNNNNYKLLKKNNYLDHSIFYLFEYDNSLKIKSYNNIDNVKIIYKFNSYFSKINNIINNINKYINNNIDKKFALFPCNMYIQYLICLGLDISKIKYFYDNNKNKLNKYLYGTDIICKDLNFYINNNEYEIILFGFLYNKEIINILNNNKIKYYNALLV